jgi:transcriptional regulator with PAS, ATPase and Fis domain
VVARLIHHHSHRSGHPLVTINCAGIPDTLLASELFGHVRGSFTGAYTDRRGWLEQADHGTVFMDEVGEMSSQMQALLLRFLENGEIQPVGSSRRYFATDVRVITATNRQLIERVEAKEFREDLYYRLNVFHIEIPPLRERPEDVAPLLDHFLRQLSERHRMDIPQLSEQLRSRLITYSWPGNARQLRNVIETLVIRSGSGVVDIEVLPREVFAGGTSQNTSSSSSVPHATLSDLAFKQLLRGDSFWSVVYTPFMRHDLTRDDVRTIVRRGLDVSDNNYRRMLSLFNLPAEDGKRLMTFLRKFQLEPQPLLTAVSDRDHLRTKDAGNIRPAASGE